MCYFAPDFGKRPEKCFKIAKIINIKSIKNYVRN